MAKNKNTFDLGMVNCCFCNSRARVIIACQYVSDFISRIPLCLECRNKYFKLESGKWKRKSLGES